MFIPSHDDIIKSLGRTQAVQQPTAVLPKIVAPVQKTGLKKAIEFGKKIATGIETVINPVTGVAKIVSQSPTVQKGVLKVLPGVNAIKQSIEQKSTTPLKEYGNKLAGQFNPSGLIRTNLDTGKMQVDTEVAKNLAMPAIGAVGEEANVLRQASKTLAKESTVEGVRTFLKGNFKNLADDAIERLSSVFAKTKNAREIEGMLAKEIKSALPVHEKIVQELGASNKAGSIAPKAEGAAAPAIGAEIPQAKQLPLQGETALLQESKVPVVSGNPLSESTTKLLQKSKAVNPDITGVASKLREFKTSTLEYLQNADERVRQLVSKPGTVVDDISDPYLKSTLYPGRVGTQMEELKTGAKEILKDIRESKVSRQELSDYLVARHAPERNLALGENAAGITTKAALARLSELEASASGANLKRIADNVQALNRRTLDILQKGGVIDEELYKTLTTRYKNHVPLNRIMESTDDIGGALSGRGFDVRSTGIKRATGSARTVDDVLKNVIYNHEQAILRAEKNIVDQATLNFVRKNKDILGDAFEVIKPRAIGKTFGKDGKPILEHTTDPRILQMFENGKRVWIKIKDPKLATALRGVNRQKLGGILNAVASFTRLYSGLMTRFNPEFALPNKLRDLQEITVYLASQKGVGMSGAARAVARDPKSLADVFAYLRGDDTPGARLYKEMKELGGTTGGMGLSTRKEVEMNLAKLEKLASSKTKRLADNVVSYIDNLNTLFEDSTRLSVYKQAIDSGLSKDRAAFLAKEASINFNRMGTGGPVINALYMFSNASIQGTVKMLRSFKNPKVLGATVAAVGGSVAAVNEWNDSVDPNWREKVSKWDRLNSLVVMLPRPSGEGAGYFTIPVSWGLKPIKVMSDYAYDAASGQEVSAKNMLSDLSVAIIQAYNPVGGTDLTSAVTPTILDTPIDIERNVSWSGNKIRPDFDPYAPKDIQYYSSLGDTKLGKIAISVSELLNEKAGLSISPADIKYAYDQYVGGAGRTISKVANTVAGAATGELPNVDEFPIISRFYRNRTEEEVSLNKGTDASTGKIKDILGGQSRDRFKVKNQAEQLYEDLKKLPPAEANARVEALKKSDRILYAKLKETFNDRKAGLSYTERLMKQLGVENGERAKFVYQEIVKLPNDKRNAYYQDLVKKKIITDNVNKQLKALLSSDKIKP